MSKLINLRHLEANERTISTIRGVGKLTSLQELKAFSVSRENGGRLEELKGMVQLGGKLGIWNIENIRSAEEAAQIRLKDRRHIEELELFVGGEFDVGEQSNTRLLEEVLDALQPPPHLKKLVIGGTDQVKLPRWLQTQELIPNQLVSLRIYDMPGVRQVGIGQENDGMFLALEKLLFSGMKSWERWAGVEEGHDNGWLPSLRELTMTDCPMLKEMPPAPPNLREFEIKKVGLKSLPQMQQGCNVDGGRMRPQVSSSSSCRREGGYLSSLSSIHITACNSLTSLSSWLGHHELAALEYLYINDCAELVSLFRDDDNVGEAAETTTTSSEGVLGRHLPSLRRLEIHGCPKLHISTEEVAVAFVNLTSLSHLEIRGCPRALTSLPGEALRHLTKLESLEIAGCEQLELLGLETLLTSSSLTTLRIYGCPKLTAGAFQLMSDVTSTPTTPSSIKLQSLTTGNRELLAQLLHFPARYESLDRLTLTFPEEEEVSTIFGEEEEEEGWWQKFPSLKTLDIYHSPNLRSLPAGLHRLSSLSKLFVSDCPEIQCLPERGLPPSLESLYIRGCPVLKKRCLPINPKAGGRRISSCISPPPPPPPAADSASDWPKIAHIPSIEIDDFEEYGRRYRR